MVALYRPPIPPSGCLFSFFLFKEGPTCYVKAHRGFYHDAIFVKRNNFNLLLHETFGGGFSPTAVLKLRRLARKVARGSVDRTAYSPKYSPSFTALCPTMQQSASLSVLCEA